MATAPAQRVLVVWCPDWPVVARGYGHHDRVAAVDADRVVACTAGARAEGVDDGQRRREAQRRCPELELIARDRAVEARAFEPVLGAVEAFAPRVEVIVPGLCAVATRGPSRYFGGDDALRARVRDAVDTVLGDPMCRVGVADGVFASRLAAGLGDDGVVVAEGAGARFLAPHPVHALGRPALVDVLTRLGIRTLGAFAALDPGDVIGRFGAEGITAHRRARGGEARPLDTSVPVADLAVSAELEPPVDRVDRAAFVARDLAEGLRAELDVRGVSCTCLAVEAETEHGETMTRLWRHEGGFGAAAMADRARWQLDGWINGPHRRRPTGGLTRLALIPDEIVAAAGRQLGFWGGESEADTRAKRAVARVEALLEPASVRVAAWCGGRHGDGFTLVAAQSVDLDDLGPRADTRPWPGALPAPHPTVVHAALTVPAEVVDHTGSVVAVSGRGVLSATPHAVSVDGHEPLAVIRWAGPWPVDQRWWDPRAHLRFARLQVITEDDRARVLTLHEGRWFLEAAYE